ncbi:MAG TPA: SDR family oxidoreductase [Dehalococcoidia bacterium]|nr:SDR family oxidoreductase [Dehalococcoidia bacterium]
MSDTVLITGASTGMGLETAVHLAERGFQVYATMRDLGKRGALDAEAARRGVNLEVLRLDVSDPASIDEAVATIMEQSGGVYAVVNNAGIEMRGFFEDLTDDELRQPFETNVFGTMAVTRAALPHMRAARRGRVVVLSSVGGKIGSMGLSAYCASRFALEGFAESLSQELMPLGIYVSLVEPGITKTNHWASPNHGVAGRATSPESPYHAWFERLETLTRQLVASSPTKPPQVAAAIHTALTAKRPKLRYMVGRRASLVVKLRRYVPEGLFERLYFGTIIRRVTQAGS